VFDSICVNLESNPAMGEIAPEDPSGLRSAPVHLLHYADANDAEVDINWQFFRAVEMMAARTTQLSPEGVTRIFTDFLIEARKLEHLEAQGGPHPIYRIYFLVKDLLIRIPLQRWLLPHPRCCSCAFCDEIINAPNMEGHMAQRHPLILQQDLFVS
jgi:hypothetical protein